MGCCDRAEHHHDDRKGRIAEILVVSGYLSSDVVLGWFPDAPNIAFLQKPFTVEQLVSEVEKHFEPVPG